MNKDEAKSYINPDFICTDSDFKSFTELKLAINNFVRTHSPSDLSLSEAEKISILILELLHPNKDLRKSISSISSGDSP